MRHLPRPVRARGRVAGRVLVPGDLQRWHVGRLDRVDSLFGAVVAELLKNEATDPDARHRTFGVCITVHALNMNYPLI